MTDAQLAANIIAKFPMTSMVINGSEGAAEEFIRKVNNVQCNVKRTYRAALSTARAVHSTRRAFARMAQG